MIRSRVRPGSAVLVLLASLAIPALACAQAAGADDRPDRDLGATLAPTSLPPARAVTLAEAFELATKHASDLRTATLAIERAEAAERTALAALLPSITGNLSYTRWDKEIERSGIVVRRQDTIGGTLNVSENLSLRAWNATRTTDRAAEASVADLANARRLVQAAVARAYFGELAARRNSELSRTQFALAERQHREVKARVDVGVAIGLDASRAELAMLDAARRVSDADASLGRAQDLLGQAIGLDEPAQASDVPMPKPNETLDAYVKRALDARPDLRSARKQQEAADLAIDDAWFRFAPSLGITWALTWTPQTTTFQPNATQWQAIATLSVPFFDGGARYGALRDAKAALKQAEERVIALKRSIRNDVRDAARRVETASRGFEFAQRSVEVARVAAEQSEAAYQAGTVTGIELDDAREAHEEAEVTAILRALERELAVVDLVAALGEADAAKKKR